VSEDPVADPNNPNLYSYGANNPLRVVDPTGLYGYDAQTGRISHSDGTITDTRGNVISTPSKVSSSSSDSGSSNNDKSSSSAPSSDNSKKDEAKVDNDKLNVEIVKSEREKQLEMDILLINFQLEMQIKEYYKAVKEKATQAVLDEILDDIKWTNKTIEYLDSQLKGTNPSRRAAIDYITKECERIGLPVKIGLAIAWTESRMKQYNKSGKPLAGENKKDGKVLSTDWGLMQINDKQWKDTYDIERVKTDWQYNVRVGLEIALDEYKAAGKAGEENLARATYSGYNAGRSSMDRYRTENDARDNHFWDFYQKSPWE
jgi:uncharacterized FlaG/YvyC family protein